MDTSLGRFPRLRPTGQLLPLTSHLPVLPLPIVLLQVEHNVMVSLELCSTVTLFAAATWSLSHLFTHPSLPPPPPSLSLPPSIIHLFI